MVSDEFRDGVPRIINSNINVIDGNRNLTYENGKKFEFIQRYENEHAKGNKIKLKAKMKKNGELFIIHYCSKKNLKT